MYKKLIIEEVRENIRKLGYVLISKEYLRNNQKLIIKDKEGYLYYVRYSNLMFGRIPNRFDIHNPYTIDNIKLWCKLNNKPFKLVSDTYEGSNKYLKWQCLVEGCREIFEKPWSKIFGGKSCPFCKEHLKIKNSIIVTVNNSCETVEEIQIKYTINTNKKPTSFIVYKAQSPSNKTYIGITSKTLEKRIRCHIHSALKVNIQYAFARAIRKYKKKISWEIIDYANSWEELCELEKYWINKLNTFGSNGYNLTLGGEGSYGYIKTEEQIKNSKNAVNKYFSIPENREKASQILKKIYKDNPEKRVKMSNTLKEYYSVLENREKAAVSHGLKPFNVYKKDTGEFVGQWISQQLCVEDLNFLSHSQVSCYLSGKYKNANGYIFIYVSDDIYNNFQDLLNSQRNKFKTFNVYKKEDNSFVMTNDNKTECATLLNLDPSAIIKCLKCKIKSHKGYLFYYLDNDPNLLNK